jgi:NADPH-dependent 2,4-dienoyl-CoA reductase/sulfur reductase-like enzyme
MEAAAVARQAGSDVVIVETAAAPLLAALGPQMGSMFAELHREHGVDLRLGTPPREVAVGAGRAAGVRLEDGTVIEADAVLVGIGVQPDTGLAERAGLAVENGVLVDAALRSSDPNVFAVGDLANHDHPRLGARIRVEHWANALKQPRTAAAAMLGEAAQYDDLPYFFSDQYDLGMEYVGHVNPREDVRVVIRGDLAARTFIAFWLDRADRPRAGMAVNTWDVIDEVKRLISADRSVSVDKLTDPSVDLSSIS